MKYLDNAYVAVDNKDRIVYVAENLEILLDALEWFRYHEKKYSVKIYQLLPPGLKKAIKDGLD
ncbi:MAG: hypothetical protein COT09_02775 [Candidatus Hydromicrobium americanum]|nr:MAG: hypothetical protein COT09_02775 [Candidatus Hydromicrobium americanum]